MFRSLNLEINGVDIAAGERKRVRIYLSGLYDFTQLTIPVEVIRGTEEGPRLFVSAAIHGDEINGVEIIRRLLNHNALKKIRGTLIAVPIVNVFGYNTKSRYLPDRRDLNRCFPGSPKGSMAGQLAHTFMTEIVKKCTHGIDLHTGAIHKTNLPQIRACTDHRETRKLAFEFDARVVVHASLRDGSLREAVRKLKIPILLFEGGEALRHNESVIRAGLAGILNVMGAIGMILHQKGRRHLNHMTVARASYWVRAPHSGSLRNAKKIGARVKKGQLLGVISDPLGRHKIELTAPSSGTIIGKVTMPLLNKGDAVFHIATVDNVHIVKGRLDDFLDYQTVLE